MLGVEGLWKISQFAKARKIPSQFQEGNYFPKCQLMQKVPVQLEQASPFVLGGFWNNKKSSTSILGRVSMRGCYG